MLHASELQCDLSSLFFLVGNNTCFYGKCYYCRESEPACAEGDIMEGSVTLWLPDVWPLQKHRHPWGRTYREGKLARYTQKPSFGYYRSYTSPTCRDKLGSSIIMRLKTYIKTKKYQI